MSQERWIGRVAVEWAKLEATLEDLTWQFLGLPLELGRNVTPRLSVETKTAILRAVAQVCYDFNSTDYLLWSYLKEIIDQFDLLKEDRNLIIHGTWGRSHPELTPIVLSLKVKNTPSTVVAETFPANRMLAMADAILAVKWRLITLFESARSSHRRALARFPLDE